MMRQGITSEEGVPSRRRLFWRLCHAPLLLLDDWSSMRRTEFGEERMRLIIEHRYDRLLATVVTTDRPLGEVEARLASRMGERATSGRSGIVLVEGPDRRKN
jgi:DNA replication protein DnaC